MASTDRDRPTDRDAPLALYRSTDGPNWHNMVNWKKELHRRMDWWDPDRPNWHGVSLNTQGRVYRVHLHLNNLQGI